MGRSGLWVLGLGGAADLGQWRKPPEGALVAVFVSLLYGKRIEKTGTYLGGRNPITTSTDRTLAVCRSRVQGSRREELGRSVL